MKTKRYNLLLLANVCIIHMLCEHSYANSIDVERSAAEKLEELGAEVLFNKSSHVYWVDLHSARKTFKEADC